MGFLSTIRQNPDSSAWPGIWAEPPLLALGCLALLAACYTGLPNQEDPFAAPDDPTLYEGDQPGECSDGADNDQDGFFDCNDPDCIGSPECSPGDDDDSTVSDDDDSATGDDDDDSKASDDDDDDSTPGDDDDDDDSTPGDDDDDSMSGDDDDSVSPVNPVITSLSGGWNTASGEMEFTMVLTDPDCDLGSPTLFWMVDAVEQTPVSSQGPDIGCSGYLNFSVPGLTRSYAYNFSFSVDDIAGNRSDWESILLTAQ